jgi:hypothetical protein
VSGSDTEGVVEDVIALVKGDVPGFATETVEAIGAALPLLFTLFAGAETDPAIVFPYLRDVIALGVTALEGYAKHLPAADVRKAFDDGLGNLLEDAKFGAKSP